MGGTSSTPEPCTVVVRFKHRKYEVFCPADVTCEGFMELVAGQTELKPQYQKLLHKGKVVPSSGQPLRDVAVVRPRAQFMLLENEHFHKLGLQIEEYSRKVDELRQRYEHELLPALEDASEAAAAQRAKTFRYLDEMCTQTLIKFDGVTADGELRQMRKEQVKRLLALAEQLERVKPRCV